MRNSEHTERVARVAFAQIEPGSSAANHRPLPCPGYRSAGASLFYVTPRGRTWLVRNGTTAQLTPAEIPTGAVVLDDDEVDDRDVIALAETADAIESARPGIYTSNGLYYVVTWSFVRMLYGDELRPVALPELPHDAVEVHLLPKDVHAVVSKMKEAG